MGQTLPAGMIDILKSPAHPPDSLKTWNDPLWPLSPALGLNHGVTRGVCDDTAKNKKKKEKQKEKKKKNPEAHDVDLQRGRL